MEEYIIEMNKITKEFPGVKALDNVTFQIKKGEIHALVGENGAGKSTLMKVLSGVHPFGSYTGDIIMNSKIQKFNNIKDSEHAGIAIIYQELALVKEMNICENIYLGSEIHKNGIINWDKAYYETEQVLKEVGLSIDPTIRVLNLGVGEQQLIEIAKALAKKTTSILILDEPTAALTDEEADNLLKILERLKEKGVTCVYISHRLEEVFRIADRITVLRDGQTVGTQNKADLTQDKLISLMVGREMSNIYPRKKHTSGNVVMEIKNWSVFDYETNDIAIENINLQIRKGEILGIAGLIGAGRSELMMSITGNWGKPISGEVFINDKKVKIKNTHDAIKEGIGFVTEDRKRYGLVLMMSIEKNVTLASLDKISQFSVINNNEEVKTSNKYVKDLKIKTPSIEQLAKNLSGGNQQKVVLGKWLMTEPKILILDEPTRGIDVGAKYEIYNIMNDLVDNGVCIVMISSELPEIIGMSDRVIVMHDGKITGELPIEEATQEKIMSYATGSENNKK